MSKMHCFLNEEKSGLMHPYIGQTPSQSRRRTLEA